MEIKSGWTISPRKVKVVVKSSATSWRFAAIVTTKGTRNTQRSVSMTMNRSIEEPCEVTSLIHGSGAARRGRPLRLGNKLDGDGNHLIFTDGCGIGQLRLVGNKKQQAATRPLKQFTRVRIVNRAPT